jgi:RNA polymerase sigma-70 factor (ECF subfamily)
MLSVKEFEILYDRYFDDVANFLYSYASDKEQLKDWIQEVFIKIWEAREEINFDNPGFKSYLLTTARNHALSQLRKENRYEYWLVQKLENKTEAQYQDEFTLNPGDISKIYRQSLSKIPSRSREAYLLSRNNGLTYSEIAEVMDVSVKTVEAHISKALQILRTELKDYLRE